MDNYEEYDVFNHDTGEFMGTVDMLPEATADDMPETIEINGVCYHAEK